MKTHPFQIGQRVVCVFADFPDAAYRLYEDLPQEGGTYTVADAFVAREYVTRRLVHSVRLVGFPTLPGGRPGRRVGFSAWRFKLVALAAACELKTAISSDPVLEPADVPGTVEV